MVVSGYGGQPVEEILRGMDYSGRRAREQSLRLPLAVAMESRTLPLGLASLFAGCGAHSSWHGVCTCGSRLPNAVLQACPREFTWWTGHDGQRLLLTLPSPRRGAFGFGGDPLDLAHPFYAPDETNLDAWIGYERTIWKDRIKWKI